MQIQARRPRRSTGEFPHVRHLRSNFHHVVGPAPDHHSRSLRPRADSTDDVIAFVNVFLDEPVFVKIPPGRRKPGKILRLIIAVLCCGVATALSEQYKLSGGAELKRFLGIEIHRDMQRRRIWLYQASYIVKTPKGPEELLPFTGMAPHDITHLLLQKVGSILYDAIITRPDVAFPVSRLARFNTNPGIYSLRNTSR